MDAIGGEAGAEDATVVNADGAMDATDEHGHVAGEAVNAVVGDVDVKDAPGDTEAAIIIGEVGVIEPTEAGHDAVKGAGGSVARGVEAAPPTNKSFPNSSTKSSTEAFVMCRIKLKA